MMGILAVGIYTLAVAVSASEVELENFAGTPQHTWTQQNDPVMGGKSTGTFTISDHVGHFQGEVVDVPFLKAPGFIKVTSTDRNAFRDISSCTGLAFTARAASAYAGYRVSFGTAHPWNGKFFASGYKAPFDAPAVGDFETVQIPFTNFSDLWDDATGNIIKTCAQESKYCPDKKTLTNAKTISFWGEGVSGKVDLKIKRVYGYGCAEQEVHSIGAQAQAAEWNNTCKGKVQVALRYNMSQTTAVGDLPFPVAQGETLADAVCCDEAFRPFAEPRETYKRKDVDLFAHLNVSGETTFYDSVCGLPLFVAPRGRTLADFQADTAEHGWPSFRKEELIAGNSFIDNSTGEVRSKCGTHLGSYLPDDKGPRWCLDLVCLAGSPSAPVMTASSGGDIPLATFDGTQGTTFKWDVVDDPVMGGQSHSTLDVPTAGSARWHGQVKIVPFLKAPGFCTIKTDGFRARFPDVSGTSRFKLRVRNAKGSALTRFALQLETKGGRTAFKQGTYSGNVTVPATGEWVDATASWADFELTWRGEPIKGPKLTNQLAEIEQIGISTYFPGSTGAFDLEIKSLAAGN